MWGKGSVFKNYRAKTQEGFAVNSVKKTEALTFRLQVDLIHDFGLGTQRSIPEKREGLAKWKAKNGDCVQDLFREALCPKCSFSRNVAAMC